VKARFSERKTNLKQLIKEVTERLSSPEKPGGGKMIFPPIVVDKHGGLWTRRREFESLPGYHYLSMTSLFREFSRISLIVCSLRQWTLQKYRWYTVSYSVD
jgi:hypothetical protein